MVATEGLILWDKTTKSPWAYNGSSWKDMVTGGGTTTATPTFTVTTGITIASDTSIASWTFGSSYDSPIWNANRTQGTEWGTTSPSDQNSFFYSATQSKILPLNIIASGASTLTWSEDSSSGTLAIGAPSGGASSGGNTTVPLLTISALGTGTYSIGSNSIILENGETCGVDFSYFIVPDNWDESSNFNLKFWGRVATGEVAKVMRFRLDYFIVTAGASEWSSGGYTTGTYGNLSVANATTYQALSSTTYNIPSGSLTKGDAVFLQLWRDATNAADTYGKDLAVISGYLKFNE